MLRGGLAKDCIGGNGRMMMMGGSHREAIMDSKHQWLASMSIALATSHVL